MAEEATEEKSSEETEQEATEAEDKSADGGEDKAEKSAEDYRKELRETDRVRKRESAKKEKEIARLQAELKKREDADKTEQEKAIEAAKEEGRKAALTEAEKDRRNDRLEVQTTRLSARGFKVGEGDDAETVRFADPDDALVYIQRDISSGTLDSEEVFDSEGKVNQEALTRALADLLERKPHLRAGDAKPPPPGSADAGKGSGKSKGLEDMSIDEHIESVSRSSKSRK